MEPVDYLKILRKHWKVVAALIVLAVGAVYLITPSEASRSYRATHQLQVESTTGTEGSMEIDNVLRAEVQVTAAAVPTLAAEMLGEDGDAPDRDELVESIQTEADPERGTLSIIATDPDPDRAVAIANAFGEAFITFVDQQQGVAGDGEGDGTEDRPMTEEEIILRLGEIDDQLEGDQLPANSAELRAERINLERRLAGDAATGPISYATLTPARDASSASTMFQTRGQRMLLAAGLALLLGFGLAIMLDRNDTRLRTKEQAEKQFGLPVLAEVPLLPLRERSRAAVQAYEREPSLAEAYRSLRTAMMLFRGYDGRGQDERQTPRGNGHATAGGSTQDATSHRQLVVVTSAEPGEGKSTTAANLALAYAEAGHSVLILNWDLWRPLSPTVFGAVDGPGVSDILDDPGPPLVRYVQDTNIPGVRIVTAGTLAGRPSPRSEHVRGLLDEARSLATVVIVDTAPLLSASVTRELATLADAVLVVSRVGRTTTEAADRCTEMLERIGANALGVVLVGVSAGAYADYYGPAHKVGYDRVAGPRRKPNTPGTPSGPSASGASGGSGGSGGGSGDEDAPTKRSAGGEDPSGGRHLRQGNDGPYRATIPPTNARSTEDRDHKR